MTGIASSSRIQTPRSRAMRGTDESPPPTSTAKPLLAVADHADERDAVDLRRVAAVRAGRDRDLVLARQVGVVGVAVEERRHLVVEGGDVEELVVREAGDGAAGEVAHGVAAGADRRQADVAEAVEDGRGGSASSR